MNLLRSLSRASARAGPLSNISRVSDCSLDRPFSALFCSSNDYEQLFSSQLHNCPKSLAFSGCPKNYNGKVSVNENFGPSVLGKLGTRSAIMEVNKNLSLPSAMSFRNFVHSGNPKEDEMERSSRPMDFIRGIFQDRGRDIFAGGRDAFAGSQYPRYNLDNNADIVHIKMLRNNTFVTLTNSKGNRKPGQKVSASAGSLPDKGGKTRYGAEAAAEHVGRKARESGVRSVVMKVNGFTYFKKKRQAIMSFREGYTHSRGDQNPIVYIEDTTRRPHNGCRLPKKRRI